MVQRLRVYDLTPDDYRRRWEEQDGRCAICRSPSAFGLLVVDHDHATGIVRGLLCGGCNTGLGLLGDTAESVGAAASYLRQPCSKAARDLDLVTSDVAAVHAASA